MRTGHETARRNTAGCNAFGPGRQRRRLTPVETPTQLSTGTARKGDPPPIPLFPAKSAGHSSARNEVSPTSSKALVSKIRIAESEPIAARTIELHRLEASSVPIAPIAQRIKNAPKSWAAVLIPPP